MKKKNIIDDDYVKLFLYTFLDLILTVTLMFVIVWFYGHKQFLIAFLAMTGLWFSVKFMCHYGIRLIKHKPMIIFKENSIFLPTKAKDEQILNYKDIKEVKILKDWKSIKIFLLSDKVAHPSGYCYVGIVYPFKRYLLGQVEEEITNCMKQKHIKIFNVTKSKEENK